MTALLCVVLVAVVADGSAKVERVADGVYAILHDNATDDWPHGNTGVVVGDDGVLVVDATYLPSRARGDIALIRRLTDRPVRWLVYTHWHFDHNNGGIAYREAFPGVVVVSERNTARYLELNAEWWARSRTAPGSTHRQELEKLEAQLGTGKDAMGAPLTPERRRALENNIARRRAELAELSRLQVVAPTLLFERQLTLRLGRRRIELANHGPGNSPQDVTIYLPEEQVLFTGDLIVQAPLPYTLASWPVPWIEVLRELEKLPVRALVPGHGPVQSDLGYTRTVRALLEAATSRVEAELRQGRTLQQIQQEVDLADVRRSFAPWAAAELDDQWRATIELLIERAFRGVRGQG